MSVGLSAHDAGQVRPRARRLVLPATAAWAGLSLWMAEFGATPADAEPMRPPAETATDPALRVAEALHGLAAAAGGAVFFVAALASMLALVALVAATAPATTSRIAAEFRASQAKCFLLGLVNALFLLFLLVLTRGKLAFVVVPLLALLLLLGTTAVSDELGQRVLALTRSDLSRLGRLLLGASVFYLASLFPVVGWFVVFPYLALTGCGACIAWLFSQRPPEPGAASAAAPAGGTSPPADGAP
ncbi:MAG: hypothetical protein HYZ53_26125 [Planctomycetes bacterium]|nr:hypothetical protein [Planctomycetota bacterium]